VGSCAHLKLQQALALSKSPLWPNCPARLPPGFLCLQAQSALQGLLPRAGGVANDYAGAIDVLEVLQVCDPLPQHHSMPALLAF